MKWDAVVLTARDVVQKKAFELQLEMFPQLTDYAEKYFVFEDTPENVRIGSGGSTILTVNRLAGFYGESFSVRKILIIHSGGLSQRLPIVSALGKVFLLLPGGKTMLEMKLLSYRPILRTMPAGVMISASDTLEYIPSNVGSVIPGEVTLFAHPSSIKVAMEHGVYVLKDGSLETVLQKPSLEELKTSGALTSNSELKGSDNINTEDKLEDDEHALTDSFFVLSPKIALRLALLKVHEPFDCETCCYGDFLRALGTLPQTKYLEAKDPLGTWRHRLASIFRGLSCRVVVLPHNSFFHFGTPQELFEHLQPDSIFCRRFNIVNQQCILSSIKSDSKVGNASIIEWCKFSGGLCIGSRSLISDLSSSKLTEIPGDVMASTIILRGENDTLRYVTAIFSVNDDLKQKRNILKWFNEEIRYESPSGLWAARLFKVCASMEESLEATLRSIKEGYHFNDGISLSEALGRKDVVQMVNFRKALLA